MNESLKKKVDYDDFTLEAITIEELNKRNEERSKEIKEGTIEKKVVGGELVLKFNVV